ncbi:adenosylmethionine--8-amino-7-oxononanoate aminotransferase BioA [Legionella impletisoli]|uniref:adenosylmethionine--8-amino-7-oxononanoate transaminase n=2 Tax=Legionella impletisoli TaxID=343510 RepID=A0A917JTI6_9GAMM|nr:adenosylmethionine--8-amino-7-oxononanoate aminotransferase BioA [Legionella impletisoli]
MKDFEQTPPLIVHQAKGNELHTNRGVLIDAISSWWCKSLGHGHPEIIAAIQAQLSRFEHVIGANTTHEEIAELGEQIAHLTKNQHVFFASDGSSAVEIAMKLALHAKQLQGYPSRNQFISLKNSYHGETLATLSVSDLGLYKKPYEHMGVTCHVLQNIPYVSGKEDPLWTSCDHHWQATRKELEAIKENACAIIVEPLIQGAGGMLCYSADYLKKLSQYCNENDLFLIADEIMTGLGRTGKWLALEHAGVKADLICLSKGLTSGTLPLSCVSVDHFIYELFYNDYESGHSFLHSHTYSGNALAISAALATLNIMQRENSHIKAEVLGQTMEKHFIEIAQLTGKLKNVRRLGAIVAGELINENQKRIGFELYKRGLDNGALLRPLGNTLYWMPPLNCDKKTIGNLAEITLKSIKEAYT